MNMKVYPLIYSRILNDDYPNGFLARPKDLDVSAASKYVIPAIENIQHAGGVRHAVFPAGDYLVYGGVACIAGKLVERILQSKVIDFAYEEYQADKAGRPLIFFIGFAVRKYELVRNELPDIDLYSTYKIYLSYLVRQWRSEKAATDFSEELELKTRSYSRKPAPQSLPAGGKRILRNYREDDFQETIDYHFACMAWGSGGDFSFLSNVLPDDAARSPFANISPYDCTPEECARRMEASGVSASYVPPAAYSGSKLRTNNVLNSTIAGMPDGSSGTRPASSGIEKKKFQRAILASRWNTGSGGDHRSPVVPDEAEERRSQPSEPDGSHDQLLGGFRPAAEKPQAPYAPPPGGEAGCCPDYQIGTGGSPGGIPARFPGRDYSGSPGDAREYCGKKPIPFEDLLDEYPELKVLLELRHLTALLSAPDFPGRSELACLSSLASLSKIRGLGSLIKLQALDQLSGTDTRHIF